MTKLWSYGMILLGGMALGVHFVHILLTGLTAVSIGWVGLTIVAIIWGIWTRERL